MSVETKIEVGKNMFENEQYIIIDGQEVKGDNDYFQHKLQEFKKSFGNCPFENGKSLNVIKPGRPKIITLGQILLLNVKLWSRLICFL